MPTSGKEESTVRFFEFAKLMHDNYEEKAKAGEFVVILIDAILDDTALEKDSPNPLYGLGNRHWRPITAIDALFHKRRPLRLFRVCPKRHLLDSSKPIQWTRWIT
jgi:hypothetical protein